MKIAIYGICKNEAKFASRFAESVKGADIVIIGDTGSSDGTQDILKSYNINVQDISVVPFRFDLARNTVLLQLPEDIDVAISMDLDDVLLPDWRKTIEDNWILGTTNMLNYNYIHAWEDEGQTIPRITILGFKVHCPKSYIWKYPIHEILVNKSGVETNSIIIKKQIMEHHPDLSKLERYSRIKIFEDQYEDFKNDPRMVHLYGRELYILSRFNEAISILKDYLKITEFNDRINHDDGIIQSRSYSCRLIAECLESLNNDNKDYSEILQWYLRNVAESPYQRESWMYLAYAWYKVNKGLLAYSAANFGMSLTDKARSIEVEGKCWDNRADELLKECEKLMIAQTN